MIALKSASNRAVTCGACVTELSMFSAIFSRIRSCGTLCERIEASDGCATRGLSGGARALGWTRGRLLDRAIDIRARDAAVAAGALDLGRVDIVLEQSPLHGWREAQLGIQRARPPSLVPSEVEGRS